MNENRPMKEHVAIVLQNSNNEVLFIKRSMKKKTLPNPQFSTPFNDYFKLFDKFDKDVKYTDEYGLFLILSLVEEIGEMTRAYLAKHGRKKSNIAAQEDESYEQELGDILISILRFARIKNINLHERIMYSLKKIEKRQDEPKR